MEYPESLEKLMNDLRRLPGVGKKSAERAAFAVLDMNEDAVRQFADDLLHAKARLHYCAECGNLTEEDLCAICADPNRDKKTICVVKEIQDVMAIEKTQEYRGLYHVLHGSISPMDGIGPDDLNIDVLLERLEDGVQEVILATPTDVSGQATASYLQTIIRPMGIAVTRIAYGIPVGTSLQFADEVTLAKALEGRRNLE